MGAYPIYRGSLLETVIYLAAKRRSPRKKILGSNKVVQSGHGSQLGELQDQPQSILIGYVKVPGVPQLRCMASVALDELLDS